MRKTVPQTHSSCSMQKKRLEKTANIRKMRRILKIGQKWPQCKSYSPCKTGSLSLKIKYGEKHAKNLCTNTFIVVLCKKRLEKTANYSKNETHFENWPKMATMQRLQPMQNGQFGLKIKICEKHAKNLCTNTFIVVLCKKRLEKAA